jgi:hypothetical protein
MSTDVLLACSFWLVGSIAVMNRANSADSRRHRAPSSTQYVGFLVPEMLRIVRILKISGGCFRQEDGISTRDVGVNSLLMPIR